MIANSNFLTGLYGYKINIVSTHLCHDSLKKNDFFQKNLRGLHNALKRFGML